MTQRRPVALVTGASRGIGRGISIELAKSGYDLAGLSRSLDADNIESGEGGINEVKRRIEELDARFLPVQGDVSQFDHHSRILDAVLAEYGQIDLLVNNAGVAPEKRLDLLETTPASFDRVVSINLRGPFFLTQLVARQMINQVEAGSATNPGVVFITSISARFSSPSRAEYCVSKAGLSAAAAIFADRLSEYGINVYEVRPGIIKTEMTAGVSAKYDDLIRNGLTLQKRWGLPEDVGKAVAALARGDFGYSTGMVVEVSGGMNVRRL
ncbi:MAG TPA: 3-ketoacyl-ACP reductase [Blastocatellia bacterium]|nr:3-ketoacyl-ACP reductase [Blastocatellia bacterium]